MVPFSPESKLSGVEKQLKPDQWLHYVRWFQPPGGNGGKVILHFGAVDHFCKVWVNHQLVGTHRGGYLPFSMEVTTALLPENNLLQVAVSDPSDSGHQARGKQKLSPGGMFYPAQSGIWQTAWLERVPDNYVERLHITPVFDQKQLEVKVFARRPEGANVRILCLGDLIAEGCCGKDGQTVITVPQERFYPWSPEDPFLYDLIVALPDGDLVQSYFAFRKFSVKPDINGIPRIFLNDSPYFLHGLLDQGYWKEGLYTPPSDQAMVDDIVMAKELGFNLLRKHVKIEPDRWYYHCDRLGMIVWQDMVNGGGEYASWFVTYAVNVFQPFLRRWKDHNYRLFARTNPDERAHFYQELAEMVELLSVHPCIGAWIPFNEGWGQFDAAKATALIRSLDPTRLIDEASGWFDQGGGDIHSIHNYFYPLRVRPQKARAAALTEYGGISWVHPEHRNCQKTYGYGTAKNAAEFTRRFCNLLENSVLPQIRNGLSALVYTQLSDVEEEVNGLLTYDRQVIKIGADTALRCAEALKQEFRRCTKMPAAGGSGRDSEDH